MDQIIFPMIANNPIASFNRDIALKNLVMSNSGWKTSIAQHNDNNPYTVTLMLNILLYICVKVVNSHDLFL